MKSAIVLCLLLIIAGMVFPAAAEVSLNFRDMQVLPVGYQSFHIYQVNGSGTWDMGLYNSTSDPVVLQTDPNISTSYILQFVPTGTDYVNDPSRAVTDFSAYMTEHYPALLISFFLIALISIAFYLGRRT